MSILLCGVFFNYYFKHEFVERLFKIKVHCGVHSA